MSPNYPQVGDAVKIIQRTELDHGREMPRGFVTKIVATDVKMQTPVVQVEAEGRRVWIARSNVKRV